IKRDDAVTTASPMMKEEKSRDLLDSAKAETAKAEVPAEQPAAA
ncbi:MAG: hypothetical protein H6R09_1340, partial [Proteobacteria bacterium]|nr:hypothetical protein [Pseudomonadota bacterium]